MIKQIEAHAGWVRTVQFSPDGTQFSSGGDDRVIRIWNTADFSQIMELKGHAGWVQTLAYTSSGDHLISGGHDNTIRVWETATGKLVATSEKMEQIVLSVDASPDRNDFISSCLLSETLRIWANEFESTDQADVMTQDTEEKTGLQADTGPQEGDLPAEEPGEKDPVAVAPKDPALPAINIFFPTLSEGGVTHDRPSILIIGQAEAEGGIQTLLINKELALLNEAGVFQAEVPLQKGDNNVELVAVSRIGKMSRQQLVIHCTSEDAPDDLEKTREIKRGRYFALIIGIEDYSDEKITDLDYPIQDADSLHAVLTNQYSFSPEDVIFLKNPTRTEIIIALDELSQQVGDSDNLLIFYAGHGYWDEKTGIGYWLPRDANRSNTANWFRNSTLRDFIGSIPSKHTLLIADACFSGSIFKTRSGFASPDRGYMKLHDLPSRKAMTSGALKEVPDKSVFVRYLIRELNSNPEKYLPSEQLFGNFKTAVLNNSPNVPQYGTIQNVGDEGGDFIFVRN
jgi:hypothetical protein